MNDYEWLSVVLSKRNNYIIWFKLRYLRTNMQTDGNVCNNEMQYKYAIINQFK